MARKGTPLNVDERFFYDHAGYSVAQGETKHQGKMRGAKALADAERFASAAGWGYEWADDWDGDHNKEFGYQPSTCEWCCLMDEEGRHLESLGCIDDATPAYRRVIEAELALEAMGRVEDEQQAERDVYSYCAL